MILFCPECGQRFEVPGHLETVSAHKCPSCGAEFGGAGESAQPSGPAAPAGGRLKFVSGGETSAGEGLPRQAPTERAAPALDIAKARQVRKVSPDECDIVRELGHQGAGVIYEGTERQTGEPVIVRRLHVEGQSIIDAERWATCATKLQNLRHPRIVSILGVGLRDGAPYVVTERALGQDLAVTNRGRSMGIKQAVQVALQVVEGLMVAHGAGALHGNLKPSNVIVDSSGRTRVCDFGLSPRAMDAGELVTSDHVAGWLPYGAPETIRDGPDRLDERSDSYGLGALLYYMLTGRPPFVNDNPRALLAGVLEGTPRPPSSLNPKVPNELDSIVMRTLEKNPSFRPSNVQAVGLELRKFERDGVAVQPRKMTARRSGSGWLTALLLLGLAGGLGYGGYVFYDGMQIEAAVARADRLVLLAEKERTSPDGLAAAVELYGRAVGEVERAPNRGKYILLFADALVESGDSRQAVDVLKRAAALAGEHGAGARTRLPGALARARKPEEAVALLKEIASSADAGALALAATRYAVEAGEALVAAGDAAAAVSILSVARQLPGRLASQLEGDEADALAAFAAHAAAALGDAHMLSSDFVDARSRYSDALRDETAAGDTRQRAAEGLVSAVSAVAGLELTAEELGVAAAFPYSVARYARTLAAQGKIEAARAAIALTRKAVGDAVAPAAALAAIADGEVCEATGDAAGARAQYEAASRLAARLEDAARSIEALAQARSSYLLLSAGQEAFAVPRFRDIVRRFESAPGAAKDALFDEAAAWALVGEGHALRLMGRPDEAARAYRSAAAHTAWRQSALLALTGIGEVMLETRARELVRPSFAAVAQETDAGHLGTLARAMVGDITEGRLIEAATVAGGEIAKAGAHAVARAYYCAALRREMAGELDGARELHKQAVAAAGDSSWYGALAQKRMTQE
jgi:tetratricopeptide (TPR) repeat protein